ncbi:MAG: S1 family peptidase [Acidobacteriota bacterium]
MEKEDSHVEQGGPRSARNWLPAALAVVALLGGVLFLSARPAPRQDDLELQKQVRQLSSQVQQLKQEQAMPAMVLTRYRNSICYIYGVYHVGFPNHRPGLRARISGTGFLVGKGLLATNRHVAEPWYEDSEADALMRRGAAPQLEKLIAFFPGSPTPITITPIILSANTDLALLRVESTPPFNPQALPLANSSTPPGDLVTVIGYPMGIAGMVAKSPPAVYERLAYRHDDIGAANELAALSLIRPSATVGHLGDVVGEKLIYDAPTAHGGSGGPVFNSRGEVIGINAAYIDGFSGGTLGVSVQALQPLLEAAAKRSSRAEDKSAVLQ